MFPLHQGKNHIRGLMIAADHLAHLLDKPLIEVCRSGELIAEGLLKAQKLYNSDFIIVFADVSVEVEAMGVELKYFTNGNPFPVNRLDFSEVGTKKIWKLGRLPELFKAAQICRAELGDDFTIFISMKDTFSLTAMVTGTEEFLISLVTDTKKALDILDICCKNQMGLIIKIIESGFIPLIGTPIASGGLIGSKHFNNFAAACLEKLFAKARQLDSFACLHICGTIRELVEPLEDLEPDLLSFEDPAFVPLLNRLPNTIPMGYVPTTLFVNDNPESVIENTRICHLSLPKPYVLSAGCDLPSKANPVLVNTMMNFKLEE